MRKTIFWLGLALAIGVPNLAILQKERLLSTGTSVLVELAPVDPRSLMQGDYMELEYRIARELWRVARDWPRDGHLVLVRDERGVGYFAGPYDGESSLAEDQLLVRYRKRRGDLVIASNAFFFQEGQAEQYASARFGELRVSAKGETLLVALVDENGERLGPNSLFE